MDRRNLIFLIMLVLSFYAVNTFFDYRSAETRNEQIIQKTAENKRKIQQLEILVKDKTVKADALPLAILFNDETKSTLLSTGVYTEDNILTIAWEEQLPTRIYATTNGKADFYTLEAQPITKGYPAVYYRGDKAPLDIAKLPEFGQFDLQVVTPLPADGTSPFSLSFGEYIDGSFTLPQKEITQLEKQLPQNNQKRPLTPTSNSIVLYKTQKGYLPLAIYQEENDRLYYLSESSAIATSIIKPAPIVDVANGERPPEAFYVLENGYQQLVFSNYGGALAEINLPFQSETNTKSVVKEISFDRQMVEDHPYNAHFPAHSYFTAPDSPNSSPIEHQKGQLGGYYPLIRRDLIEKGPWKSIKIPPKFYAFNIVSKYPEVADLVYTVKHFDKNSITFEASQGHRRITKTYTLETDIAPYTVHLKVKVDGDSRGLWLTTGVPEVELISGSPASSLKYRVTKGNKSVVKLESLPSESPSETRINSEISTVKPDWLCNSNGFLGLILDPLSTIDSGFLANNVPGNMVPTRLVEIGQEHDRFNASKYPGYEMMLPLWSKGGTMEFRIFAGPFSTPILKAVDAAYSDPTAGYNPDYIACQSFHGWFSFISEPFAKFLFLLMSFFHSVTGSWALSIVLLTVALRLMLYPLNAWSTRSMLRTQKIMPKVQAIQAKYKKDPKRAQMEIINLYREEGVNPLSGMTGGCFPLLIQMPFLFGMFDLLKSSFQLRGATFIPGWINDLSAPDVLFSWSTPLPIIGTEFHLLPIILGVIMFIQPRIMSPLPKDKSQWTDQQKQQRTMGNMMAIVFMWMFYNFPSGLNIYWTSSMLLGILQQWWNKRQLQTPTENEDVVLEVQPKGKVKKANR